MSAVPNPHFPPPMLWPRRAIEEGRGAGGHESEVVRRNGGMAFGRGLGCGQGVKTAGTSSAWRDSARQDPLFSAGLPPPSSAHLRIVESWEVALGFPTI